ncbi:MAG: SDR family oxidoreductase, partial [Phycisphaerae bacterium]|nr:SDR family oxidoreductase [Phycisphaerae bacterium]
LPNVASEIGDTTPTMIFPIDITISDAVDEMVGKIVDRFGRIDVIVNCAGVAPLVAMDQMTPEIWKSVLNTNLSGPFYVCRAVWPVFRKQNTGKQNGGVIVNISSESARDPFNGFAAYGAAKAGLNLLGKAMAKEGEPFGIRVHTIAPAAVETDMFRKIVSPEAYPPENTLLPDDVARVVVQCAAGDLACSSGEVIYVHRRLS